jgi:hypothetical protein
MLAAAVAIAAGALPGLAQAQSAGETSWPVIAAEGLPVILAQACPPGYNAGGGRCTPNRNDGEYGGRGYYRGGGYGRYDRYDRYGEVACPPGYNSGGGRCTPNRNADDYYGRRSYGYGAPCPPGYDSYRGRCVENRY